MKGHNGTIRVVRFQPHEMISTSALLASAGAGDCVPRIWDVNGGLAHTSRSWLLIETVTRCSSGVCIAELPAHRDTVHGLAWIDASTVITGCDKGFLYVHDLRRPTGAPPAWQHHLHRRGGEEAAAICCLADLPCAGSPLAVGCAKGWLTVVDWRGGMGAQQCVLNDQQLHSDDIRSLSVMSGSGVRTSHGDVACEVLSSSYDGSGAVWGLRRGLEDPCRAVLRLRGGHADKMLCATFAGCAGGKGRQGLSILTSGADGQLLLWQSI